MRFSVIILILLLLCGCASYYQRNAEFQQRIAQGDMAKAEKLLEGNKRMQRDRNRLLYLLNMGFVNHMQQEFEESNRFFNEADLWIEDQQKNYASEALALISNPEVKPYRAEDFEVVMVHYYKALNYLNLGQFDATLVEARRMNIVLNALNDKYKDHKNRYQVDAFAHIIMGLAYEATGDLNNAFIAYRNAYNIYTSQHGYFELETPKQLKDDLLRLAYLLGFQNDLQWYKDQFGIKDYSYVPTEFGEVVMLWQNGFGPVKDEWSVNFFAVPGQGGYINFENEELGLVFPFYVGDDKQKRNDLLALKVVRVAFPKYVERENVFVAAEAKIGADKYALYHAQDINAIAFKTLEDRFVREMGSALLRLATKKLTEIQLQQQHDALGALATVTNAITEKADTRNWQTLPHDIYYARVPLRQGENRIDLNLKDKSGKWRRVQDPFIFEGQQGRMYFQPYQSLEHLPAAGLNVVGF